MSTTHRGVRLLGAYIVGVLICALLATVTAGTSALEFFVVLAVVTAAAWALTEAAVRRKRQEPSAELVEGRTPPLS